MAVSGIPQARQPRKKGETNQRKTTSTKEKLEGVCFPVKAPLLVPCDPENYKENKLQHWSNMLP